LQLLQNVCTPGALAPAEAKQVWKCQSGSPCGRATQRAQQA